MRKLLAILFLFALPAFAVNKRRDDYVFTTLGSGLAPGSGYIVAVLPVGAEASAGSSGTTISVRSGHGFSSGQKMMVGTDTTKVRTVSTANATSLIVSSNVSVSSGDIIVNLGSDTGFPSWNDSTVAIYSDMQGAVQVTPSQVSTNASGAFGYWHDADAAWEVIRKANGTIVGINRGAIITDEGGSGLASDPAACSANQYVTDLSQAGALTCSALDTDLATFGAMSCADGEIPKKSTGVWTCGSDAAGGGLPADPAACGANAFVTDQNASGVLTCTQPAFSNLSGAATDAQVPDTITASNYQPVDADLTAIAALGCSSGQVIEWNGSAFVCATDDSGTLGDGDKGDVVVSSSGSVWEIDTGIIVNADINASAAIAATKLETAVIVSTEIDTSAKIAGIVGDETGTGVLVLATAPTIVSPLTVSGGSDDTRGLELIDNTTTCADPASGSTSICTIAGEPYMRDTGGTAREMLYTAGGDYGDFGCSTGACSLDAGTVAFNDEIANSLSCAALQSTRRNAGGGAWECFTPASASFPKQTECFTLFDSAGLADTNDIPSVWRAPAAVTVTEVWAETDAGTPSINLQRDDGVPANVLSANLTPTTGGATGTIDTNEDNFADGDRLDFVMVSASTADRINVCIEFTYD